jgi:hypothetical protein
MLMTHRGTKARRAFDEAKEAAKKAAKEAAKEVAKEATRPAKASTSIATGDVMRCGRTICQGTRDAEVHRCLVDSPIRQAKADLLHLLRKGAGGTEMVVVAA